MNTPETEIDLPPCAETWLQFVNALCAFAYTCGIEAAQLGLPREWPADIEEPQCVLAFESGWDDEMRKAN